MREKPQTAQQLLQKQLQQYQQQLQHHEQQQQQQQQQQHEQSSNVGNQSSTLQCQRAPTPTTANSHQGCGNLPVSNQASPHPSPLYPGMPQANQLNGNAQGKPKEHL